MYMYDVVIRTNFKGTDLIVNAPNDTVRHFDEVGSVHVIAVDSTHCYEENGKAAFTQIDSGKYKTTETADVELLFVSNAANVKVAVTTGTVDHAHAISEGDATVLNDKATGVTFDYDGNNGQTGEGVQDHSTAETKLNLTEKFTENKEVEEIKKLTHVARVLHVDKVGGQKDCFATIAEAIEDADAGDIVELCSGTHNEAVIIEKDITLQGVGGAIISSLDITKQDKLSGESYDYYGMVCVKNANVTIKNIIITGNSDEAYNRASTLWAGGRYAGLIVLNSSVTLENCSIRDMTYANGIEGLKGGQNGFGIYAANSNGTTTTLALKNTEISNFNKAGIVARANIDIEIDGCTFTGFGEQGQIAQNGVQFAGKATFKNSKFEGMIYTGENPKHGCVAIYNTGSGNATVIDVNVHDVDFVSSVAFSSGSGITTIKSGSYSSFNSYIEEGTTSQKIAIEGGTFNFDVTKYIDGTNYKVINNNDGTWTVTEK